MGYYSHYTWDQSHASVITTRCSRLQMILSWLIPSMSLVPLLMVKQTLAIKSPTLYHQIYPRIYLKIEKHWGMGWRRRGFGGSWRLEVILRRCEQWAQSREVGARWRQTQPASKLRRSLAVGKIRVVTGDVQWWAQAQSDLCGSKMGVLVDSILFLCAC
jgi:hypothetical protein